MDDFSAWAGALDPEYKWLATAGDQCLLEVVSRILEIVDDDKDDPIVSVRDSSLWAVCMAYMHYRNAGDVVLSQEDLLYARLWGGELGVSINDRHIIRIATAREYLEWRDPGFAVFSLLADQSSAV